MAEHIISKTYQALKDRLFELVDDGTLNTVARWNSQPENEEFEHQVLLPAVYIEIGENAWQNGNWEVRQGPVEFRLHVVLETDENFETEDFEICQAVHEKVQGFQTEDVHNAFISVADEPQQNYNRVFDRVMIYRTFVNDESLLELREQGQILTLGEVVTYTETSGSEDKSENVGLNVKLDTITVVADNTAPLTGETVNFSFTGMTADVFSIDFGDGTIQSTETTSISHKYLNPGSYTIRAWAGDNANLALILTKSGYITVTEDDLSAYGTLGTWVNLQDESLLTLNGSDEVTNIVDNVAGLDWINQPAVGKKPNYMTRSNDNGVYKFARFRKEIVDSKVSDPVDWASASNMILDDINDELQAEVSTTAYRAFYLIRLHKELLSLDRVSSSYKDSAGSWLRLDSYLFVRTRTSAINQNFSISPYNMPYARFILLELHWDGAGNLEIILDGDVVATATTQSGRVGIGIIGGGDNANQNFKGDMIGWCNFIGSVPSGANLTAVRDYWNNKKPDY